jgi:hypothetical protein
VADRDLGFLLSLSEPLVFRRDGSKFYARTPGGEIAYGDASGLYEWRHGKRIHYSGGDQQASGPSGFYQHSDLINYPFLRGLDALKLPGRLN